MVRIRKDETGQDGEDKWNGGERGTADDLEKPN